MKIIHDTDKWVQIIQQLPKDKPIYGSTYNISKYKETGYVDKILKSFEKHIEAHLIVGVPKFYPCIRNAGDKGGCPSCYKRHVHMMKRFIEISNDYPKINFTFTKDVHTKFIVCDKYNITGGRNISDSDILDLSFITADERISKELIDRWNVISDTASYDIGNDGPLVFLYPYKGEIFANSSEVNKEYRELAAQRFPGDDVVDYWIKKGMV